MTDNPHYVTPEEAKEIGCVMSMARDNPSLVYQTCLGKTCMAWRWRLMGYEVQQDSEKNSWPAIYSTTHGYCGMVR